MGCSPQLFLFLEERERLQFL